MSDLFEIDQYNLDRELIDQPKRFYEISKDLSDLRDTVERLEVKAKVTKAELSLAIREDPIKYGIPKATVDAINAAVELHPDFKAIQTELLDAKHAVDLQWAAAKAMDQRKSMLEKLVQLHGQQYFSVPTIARSPERVSDPGPACNQKGKKDGDEKAKSKKEKKKMRRERSSR